MKMNMTRCSLLAGAAVAALGFVSSASAQTSGASAASVADANSGLVLGDIVVTARRRAESVQSVPIAVSAVSGQSLQAQHIVAMTDLQSRTPSLRFSSLGVPGTMSYVIRGLRSNDNRANQDQTVALYFADAIVAPQPGAMLGFYDLASVQVLKGPQGTLFGRNTTGGAVLMTPVKPGDEFEGYARAEYGSYNRYALEGAVTIPFNDKLSARFTGRVIRRDGFGHAIAGPMIGRENSNEKQENFRVSINWKPTDNFENYIVGYHDHFHNNNNAMIAKFFNPASTVALYDGQPHTLAPGVTVTLPNYFADLALLGPNNRYDTAPGPTPSYVNHKVQGVVNTTTLNLGESGFGDITLKNIGSYRQVASIYAEDADGTRAQLFSVNPQFEHFLTYSDEFQVAGKAPGLDWIVGAYYFRVRGNDVPSATFFGGLSPTNPIIGGQYVRQTSKAVYAQTTINLGRFSDALQKLNFTAGGRYTWEDRFQIAYPTQGNGAGGLICRFPAADLQQPFPLCYSRFDIKFKKPTWTFSLDYRFEPGKMVYFTQRRGFRSGGWNNGATSIASNVPFLPETVDDFEVGLKADWDVGGVPLRTNIAAYQSNYNNIQRQTTRCNPNGSGGCDVSSIIGNASKARMRGIEFEADAKLASFFELSGFYTYTKPKYLKYDLRLATGQVLDLSSSDFPWTPRHAGAVTGKFIVPISPDKGDLSASVTYTAQTGYWLEDRYQTAFLAARGLTSLRDAFRQEAYYMVDFSINWDHVMGSGFDVSVWGKNLNDAHYFASAVTILPDAGFNFYSFGDPRTFGVSLTRKFGAGAR